MVLVVVFGVALLIAVLVGAVLAPTDPVFASAIVGRKEAPAKLRQWLTAVRPLLAEPSRRVPGAPPRQHRRRAR
ncbi:hypothetical protein [Streptomyces sp. DG1A-41]|uniref:hypothetical protein n=1 Tax=Streptomyces sp. DG1A-41 TaxID=3125779 RepID=UPI0030CDC2CE